MPKPPPTPITHNPSPITYNTSPLTPNPSPITHHPSPITYTPSPLPPLTTLYLYLTNACNLNCRHCWIDPAYTGGDASPDSHLPWPDIRRIVEEAVPLGLSRIKITGGEPFAHPEMCDILYGLREMGLVLSMETNGALIGEKEADALKDCGVAFSVSVDGPTAEIHDDLRGVRGAFDETMAALNILRRRDIGFQIITSLYRGNADRLLEMVDFARRTGARSLKINVISAIARSAAMNAAGELLNVAEVLTAYRDLTATLKGREHFNVIFDIPPAFKTLKEIRGGGFGTCGILGILGVLHNGRAGLCGIGLHVPDLDFGDLKTLGVRKIWEETPALNAIRQGLPGRLEGICGRCVFRCYCMGKCIADTYNARRNLFGPYGFCQEAHDNNLFPKTRMVN